MESIVDDYHNVIYWVGIMETTGFYSIAKKNVVEEYIIQEMGASIEEALLRLRQVCKEYFEGEYILYWNDVTGKHLMATMPNPDYFNMNVHNKDTQWKQSFQSLLHS